MKKFGIVATCTLLILGIGVGIFFLVNKQDGNADEVKGESSIEGTLISEPVGAILPNSRLTENEKTLTGVWEAEGGWILAIRERALTDNSFSMDAIAYCPTYDQWFKITRVNVR